MWGLGGCLGGQRPPKHPPSSFQLRKSYNHETITLFD